MAPPRTLSLIISIGSVLFLFLLFTADPSEEPEIDDGISKAVEQRQQRVFTAVPTASAPPGTRKPEKKLSPAGIPYFPDTMADYEPLTPGGCKPGAPRTELNFEETKVMGNTTRVWPMLPDRRLEENTEHNRCQRIRLRQLQVLKAVMEQLGLKDSWFIAQGTLLGAVRHGGFIPWDYDVDVAMSRQSMFRLNQEWQRFFPRDMFLQTQLTENSYDVFRSSGQIRITDRYSTHEKVPWTFPDGRRVRPYHVGAAIDLLTIVRDKNDNTTFKLLHYYPRESDLFPTSEVCFEGIMFPAPRNVSKHLTLIFGEDYMTLPPDRRAPDVVLGKDMPHPCLATTRSKGSKHSLRWHRDHPQGQQPKLFPRDDPPPQ